MSEQAAKKNYKEYIHMAIVFVLMFFFGQLPTFSTVTPEGMNILGIFIGIIYGWLTIGMLWPSILAMIALILTNSITLDELYVQSFGNLTFLMVLFMWILCNVLTQAQISDKIAIKILSLKIVDGKPWVFFAVSMLAAWVVFMLLGGIVPLLIFFPIIGGICVKFGYPAFHKTTTFLLFGILVASCLGQMCLPIMGTPLALLGIYMSMDQTFVLNLGQYALFAIPFTLVILVVFLLSARFLFRVDMSKFDSISSTMFDKESARFDKRQRAILIVFFIVLLMLIVPSFLPASAVKDVLNGLGSCGSAFIGIILMMTIKVDGKPLMDFRAAAKDVSWDVLITVAACLPLMSLLTSEGTGVQEMLMQVFMPILGGMPPIAFGLCVVIVVVLLTNFMSNYVAAIIGWTLTLLYSAQIGASMLPVVYTLLVCSHLAFATPAASVFAQIAFANTQWIEAKSFMKYTTLMLIPLSIAAGVFGILWGNVIA